MNKPQWHTIGEGKTLQKIYLRDTMDAWLEEREKELVKASHRACDSMKIETEKWNNIEWRQKIKAKIIEYNKLDSREHHCCEPLQELLDGDIDSETIWWKEFHKNLDIAIATFINKKHITLPSKTSLMKFVELSFNESKKKKI